MVRVFEFDYVISVIYYGRWFIVCCFSEVVGFWVIIIDWIGVDIDLFKFDVYGWYGYCFVKICGIVINNIIY